MHITISKPLTVGDFGRMRVCIRLYYHGAWSGKPSSVFIFRMMEMDMNMDIMMDIVQRFRGSDRHHRNTTDDRSIIGADPNK